MMVKICVIFMPFSNPTCHFRDTADFTGYPPRAIVIFENLIRSKQFECSQKYCIHSVLNASVKHMYSLDYSAANSKHLYQR